MPNLSRLLLLVLRNERKTVRQQGRPGGGDGWNCWKATTKGEEIATGEGEGGQEEAEIHGVPVVWALGGSKSALAPRGASWTA